MTITSSTTGATIHYTIDGTTPTPTSGFEYSGAITVSHSLTLKAVAFKAGWSDSTVTSAQYQILPSREYIRLGGRVIAMENSQLPAPSFDPLPDTYPSARNVTIIPPLSGATIRYTVNGSEPSRTNGQDYAGPISISSTTGLKAFAFKNGWADSPVATGQYNISPNQVATPSFTAASNAYTTPVSVGIITTPSDATIRYTINGSTPTTQSAPYSSSIPISTSTEVKAFAHKLGWLDSDVATACYLFPPSITPGGNTYDNDVSVELTSGLARIHYTLDGSEPTVNSPLYSGPIPITQTTTLKAISTFDCGLVSAVNSATFNMTVATPTISPAGGAYPFPLNVTMGTITEGGTVHYTIDGSEPTEQSPAGTAITLQGPATVRAKAFREGYSASQEVSAQYTRVPTQITLTSVPTGLPLTGEGSSCASPCLFNWTPGSYTIEAPEYVNVDAGTRWAWQSWSDGGARSHEIAVGASSATYIAYYQKQYSVNVWLWEGQGTFNQSTGWYADQASVTFEATPAQGFLFWAFHDENEHFYFTPSITRVITAPGMIVAGRFYQPNRWVDQVNISNPGGNHRVGDTYEVGAYGGYHCAVSLEDPPGSTAYSYGQIEDMIYGKLVISGTWTPSDAEPHSHLWRVCGQNTGELNFTVYPPDKSASAGSIPYEAYSGYTQFEVNGYNSAGFNSNRYLQLSIVGEGSCSVTYQPSTGGIWSDGDCSVSNPYPIPSGNSPSATFTLSFGFTGPAYVYADSIDEWGGLGSTWQGSTWIY